MKKFAIRYISKTCASISDRKAQQNMPLSAWNFAFEGGDSVVISDLLRNDSEINLHQGLKIIASVSAPTIEEAKITAKNRCELLLNLITFITQVSSHSANLMDVIEITNADSCPYTSMSYPSEDKAIRNGLRKIDQKTFNTVYSAFMTEPTNRGRILRAITWLRKGLNERDPTDEFVSYWIGIEIIGALLRDKMKAKVKDPDYWDSIEDIFVRKLNVTNFKEIKKGRDELLHGFVELNNAFMERIHSYKETVRKALIYSISDLLNLPTDIEVKIIDTPLLRSGGELWIATSGSLTNIPIEFDQLATNFPHLETKYTASNFSITDDGKLLQKVQTTYTHIGPADAKWIIEAVELHGDTDPTIDTGSVKLNIKFDSNSGK